MMIITSWLSNDGLPQQYDAPSKRALRNHCGPCNSQFSFKNKCSYYWELTEDLLGTTTPHTTI